MFQSTFQANKQNIIKVCVRTKRMIRVSLTNLVHNKRVRAVKRMNMNNKLLFGPVMKTDASGTTTEISDGVEDQPPKCTTDLASEIYWLNEHTPDHYPTKQMKSPNPNVRRDYVNKSKSSSDSFPKPLTIQSSRDVIKDLLPKRNKTPRTIAIPFTDCELNAILKYPMYCEKTTQDKVKDAAISGYFIPSVSKVLQGTMPDMMRNALKRWKSMKIAELGEDGFREFEQRNLQTGSLFHSCLENYLINRVVPDTQSPVYNLWQSVDTVVNALDPKPLITEKPIIHPVLKYKGIVDSVSVIKDKVCVLEWKTSEKEKSSLQATFDAPLQLCAYMGALNIDPRYQARAQEGLIVVAYKNGTEAHSFHLSEKELRKYWKAWLARLHEYWIRTRDGTVKEPI